MDNIPKELEETQLNLQVVVDPETKCITMNTLNEELATNGDLLATGLIANDPLHQPEFDETDLEKMSELERLIYSERQRLLNLRMPKISEKLKKRKTTRDNGYFADVLETNSYHELTQNEKSKLRMRMLRKQESSDERDFRRFRARIITMKVRLMQKLRNIDDETFFKDLTKRNSEKIKQKRLELKANETPEQRALRKQRANSQRRLAIIRRKLFKTPEELLVDKEKRMAYMEKFRSRHTEEQRQALQKVVKEKAKERRRKNKSEWKEVEMVVRGVKMDGRQQ